MSSRYSKLSMSGRGGGLPIRLVFTNISGFFPEKLLFLCAEVVKISCPSRKKVLFSGKNVSKEDKLTSTLSDSTFPKSGFIVVLSWRLLDGFQNISKPTL